MKSLLITLFLSFFCLSGHAVSIESAFQLGEKKHPRLDRLLPNVASFMAFSKDSTKLIVKGMEGSLVEWDLNSQQKREIDNIPTKRLFAYATVSNQMLIQTEDNVSIQNIEGENEIQITDGGYELGSLSSDGTLAVLSKGEKEFELWQLVTGSLKQTNTYQTTLPIRNGLTISNDGNYVAAAEGTYRDGEGHKTVIEIWDTSNGKQPWRVFNTGEILGVWNLAFSNDGRMLAVDTQLNAKSGIRVWDIHTGTHLLKKSAFEAYWTRALAFAPNNTAGSIEYLFSGDEKGNLRVWMIPGGEASFWVTYPTGIQALAFSPDAKYLAVALWDTTIQILRWNSNGK